MKRIAIFLLSACLAAGLPALAAGDPPVEIPVETPVDTTMVLPAAVAATPEAPALPDTTAVSAPEMLDLFESLLEPRTDTLAVETSLVAAEAAAAGESAPGPVKKQRFLPVRRRIDREINKIRYVYKGEVMLGLTASYGTLSSEDSDFLVIVDNINASGAIASVKPFLGYFYRDNRCIGFRFGYTYIDATLDTAQLDLGESNDVSFSVPYIGTRSNNYAFGIFHRAYAGLDPKGRFGLFAEVELSMSTGHSQFAYDSGDERKTTFSDNLQARLSFNPGAAVYIFPNVCATISFGLGGIQYAHVTQRDAEGNKIGTRDASKMRFRLNLAAINIGMNVHLWKNK